MKKRNMKVLALLMTVTMAGTMLAGCGDSGSTSTGSTGGATASSSGTADASSDATAASSSTADASSEDTTGSDDVVGELPRNETLYFAGQQWGTVNDYNPMSANSNNAMVIAQGDASRVLVYETLYMWNPLDAKMYPLLADGDPVWNDNRTEITVKIKADAKWNDGTPVTAKDVAATYHAHVDYNSSTGAEMKSYIADVVAQDDSTVVFKLTTDDSGEAVNPVLAERYLPMLYIMQENYLKTVADRNNNDAEAIKMDKMDDLVTSGPYKKYFDNDQNVVLIRDDNYWGQADSMWGKLPVPKYISHPIFKDNAAATTAFQNGDIDVAQIFITDLQKLWLEQDLPISTYVDEAPYQLCMTMPTLFFNTEVEGLDQVAVRKAIAMAVDYDQVISSAMSGQSPTFADVPRSVMNPTDAEQAMVDQDALKEYQWSNADVEGAKKLLDDAGIVDTDGDGIREYNGKNLSYKAECPTGWSDWNATLEIVAAAGKNIGINIETYFPEAANFSTDYSTGNFEITMQSGPGTSVANPYMRCRFFMSSDYNDLEVNFSGNFGHYQNDRVDEILAAIPHETDDAKLKDYYTELSKIMLEDCPCVPLMYRPQVFHEVNESVWTNYPQKDDGTNVPPMDCTDGYGVAALYNLELIDG